MNRSSDARTANIVYSIQAHKNLRQVARLINRLDSPHSAFYVHIYMATKSEQEEWKKEIKSAGTTVHLDFIDKGAWGGFGQVDSTLADMAFFQRMDYSYFINLSGQCYPLVNKNKIHEFFLQNKHGYIEYRSMPAKGWKKGGMYRLYNRFYRISEKHFLSIPRIKKDLPLGLAPYGGSSWFCLNKVHVEHILNFIEKHPEFVKYFQRVLSPDEIFFHTILANSALEPTLVKDNLRYIIWEGGKTPAYLTSYDIKGALASGKLFGRKFDLTVDHDVLDRIDESTGSKYDYAATP